MPLNFIDPQMTTGLLKTSNALSELAGGASTGYQNTGYGTLPIGVILPFSGTSVPAGWLLCFGQSISRSLYPELFAVIGVQYGSASGTTFNVPDLRGRVVAGRDNMGGTAASRMTDDVLGESPNTLGSAGGLEYIATVETTLAGNADVVSQDGSNLQPTMILNYIIKANVNVVAVP
jgi:microcystin-dependent protein